VDQTGTDITPVNLKAKLDRGDRLELVSACETHEIDIAPLPPTKWLPPAEVHDRVTPLPPNAATCGYRRPGSTIARAVALHGQFGEPILDAEVLWAAPVKAMMPQ